MKPPSFADVPVDMTDWLRDLNRAQAEGQHMLFALASAHGRFEQIHPFRDGNGRVGRLLLNLMLVRLGYPPAVFRNRLRSQYLSALRRADAGDAWPLTEMVARAVKDNLDRFLLPNLAGPVKLLPLTALGRDPKEVRALRAAADRGRLRAVEDEAGRWMSTCQWVTGYREIRRVGRPRKSDARTG
jgi:hypothetical protein